MYELFHIKNFRCFRDFSLESLSRVNLIAGVNNVGKTALLEAIFLHSGFDNPQLIININAFRGLKRMKADVKEIMGHAFNNYEMASRIEIVGFDNLLGPSTLQIYLAESTEILQLISSDEDDHAPEQVISTTPRPATDLIYEYQDATGKSTIARLFVRDKTFRSEQSQMPSSTRPTFFLSTHERFLKSEAERFSELDALNRQESILSALRILEPRLTRLSNLPVGGDWIIHGDIGMTRLIPLTMLGEGVNRLASIALSIASSEHGVVLIDEIENGLHHSVMVKVWTAIAQATRAADVQIFATTHSWECICAAHEAFSSSEVYDFRLHRLERNGDDDIRAVTFDQERLDTAIKTGLEVR
jgi:predicted ATPase